MRAIFSPCGNFRYRLEREVQPDGPVFAFLGVNGSTATAEIDDQTVRKWNGFALRNGCSRYIVGNAFAYCATDVSALASVSDAIGPENDRHLALIIQDADVLVACWGARSKLPDSLHPRLDWLRDQLFLSGKPVKTFGLSKSGDPLHPLMLAYATPLVDWCPSGFDLL